MKLYEKPEFSVKLFMVEDVITVSGEAEDTLKTATIAGGEAAWNEEWNGVYDTSN